jgi:hypothetical protein
MVRVRRGLLGSGRVVARPVPADITGLAAALQIYSSREECIAKVRAG